MNLTWGGKGLPGESQAGAGYATHQKTGTTRLELTYPFVVMKGCLG